MFNVLIRLRSWLLLATFAQSLEWILLGHVGPSVRPSVRMCQLAFLLKDFRQILYWGLLYENL
jgi:hypothetical protein